MKFLSNTYNPKLEDAKEHVVTREGETQTQAWQRHQQWLKGKAIGKPQATQKYTVSELEEMDMVGVYSES